MNIPITRANPPLPPGTISPVPGGATMPVGEQIRFLSSRTGAWVLDTYLEMAELGGRTIADLLADLFDQNGVLILSGLNNWLGFWQAGQQYRPGDTFSNQGQTIAYVTVRPHTSSSIASDLAAGNIDEVVVAPYGPSGPQGPVGPQGPQGAPGQTVQLIGSFGASMIPAQLPPSGYIPANWDAPGVPPVGYQFMIGEGMTYKPSNTSDPLYGHIFSYVGTSVNSTGWVDEGSVQGPPGPPGTDGGAYVVVAHLATAPIDVNNPPLNPPSGLLVIDLDDASFGQASIPAGGTTGQVLVKNSGTSYDTGWYTIPAGPQGPPGATGATGPAGAPGAPGKDGVVPEAPTDGQVYVRQGSTASWQVAITNAGGVMTGPVTVPANTAAAGDGLVINGPSPRELGISGERGGVLRWRVVLGGSTAESGSNTGSNFYINAYDDTGAFLYQPIFINRATGQVKVNITNGATGFSPHLDSSAGVQKAIYGSVNSQDRWSIILGGTGAETGSNAGSDFGIQRFSDTGAYLGQPLLITRSTGNVTIAQSLSVGVNATVSGTLTVSGAATASGTVTSNSGFQLTNAASAWYASNNTARSYLHGMSSSADANYYICYDQTAGATRMYCNSAGNVVVVNSLTVSANLTVSGNFNTNQIICSSLQVNAGGTNSVIYQQNNWRSWYWINDTAGNYSLVDNSAGAYRLSIYTSGAITVYQTLTVNSNCTVSGNFNTNQINGTVIIASGNIQCNVASNANAMLYLQGARSFYIGSMTNSELYITDNSRGDVALIIDPSGHTNLNGHNLTCAYINTGYIDLTNGVGIGFAQQGGGSRKSFTSTGTQLTHYINGGAAGSWNFNTPSDERIKTNIREVEGDALEDLRKVRLISFDEDKMRDARFQPTHIRYGFSAQKMRDAIPEAVNIVEIFDNKLPSEMLTIDVMPLLARCIGAIQQLANRLDHLEARL